ncbi:PREDICTED: uncharacterized protein LOC109126013 [Camelina sativa]|uniref:Uncharacterized protein LOC109126013 n=1 Tax=Camelina sativa TaxID=90675 RepID=A0ABM1QCP6_CAMSA|nr:PREDICTED: uncharacterized protein LOC109126013 [Camelina sativa]
MILIDIIIIIVYMVMMMMMMRIVYEWSDEDCMKVDEDKLDVSFIIPRLGNFDPLASFGSPRNQQIIIISLPYYLSFCLCFLVYFVVFNFVMFVLSVCVCDAPFRCVPICV